MEFNAIIKNLLSKRARLDKAIIEAQGLSNDEVKEYNRQRAILVAEDKLMALKAENCVINYKGTLLPFNPIQVEGKNAIVWKNVDKNAFLVATPDKENKVALSVIACVASTNKQYQLRSDMARANKNKYLQLFANVLEGLNWEAFVEKCKTYKNFRTCKCTGALKEIK